MASPRFNREDRELSEIPTKWPSNQQELLIVPEEEIEQERMMLTEASEEEDESKYNLKQSWISFLLVCMQ